MSKKMGLPVQKDLKGGSFCAKRPKKKCQLYLNTFKIGI